MTASLGTKRHCPECSAKFYDMGALEVVCPKCDFAFPIHLTSRETPLSKQASEAVPLKPKRYKVAVKDEDETIDGMADVIELEEFDDDGFDDIDHLEEVEDHHEDPEVDINSDDADDEMFIDEIGDDDVHLIDEPDEVDFERRESL